MTGAAESLRRSVLLQSLALGALALGVLWLLLVATGHDASVALNALWRGAFGSSYAIVSATMVRAVPLALAGLAVAVAFRAGILNVGAEGQLLVGAAAATAVASVAGAMQSGGVQTGATTTGLMQSGAMRSGAIIVLMLIAATGAGALWAGVAAWLRQRFGVLEVISTIMLNFLALYLVGYLVRGPLQEPTGVNPQSLSLPPTLQLPTLVPGSRLHIGALFAVVLAGLMWWWLRSTAAGFRLRAVGLNRSAAASAGRINVSKTTAVAFLASGALAGLAGGVQYTGVTYALYENFSPGYGYIAIAVALLARLNPLGVLLTALLFGALESGGNAMQRDAGVPSAVVSVVEAALILLIVAADRWQARSATPVRA